MMSNDSRASMVRSAAKLISTRGVNATAFSDVLADSGAPRGSIYHHFPDGKRQLAEDAVQWTGERVSTRLAQAPTTSPAAVLRFFTEMWRAVVISSNATAGCAIAGVTVDSDARTGGAATAADDTTAAGESAGSDEASLLPTVAGVFDSWTALLAAKLREAGVPARRATPIATTALAAMEGALILCRAAGSVAPLDRVATQLQHLLPEPSER
jgi:TetR/AcrR family transcriptional regulator, lmrAB and yxaGH operons repressor